MMMISIRRYFYRFVLKSILLAAFTASLMLPNFLLAAPLHEAVKAADVVKIQQLLGSGIDINLKDEQGYTPLHWAVDLGLLEISQLLLEHQADVTSMDNSGNTPMHIAAAKGRRKAVTLLIEHGAEVIGLNHNGMLPLYLAIQEGRIATVELLLAKDASTASNNYSDEGGTDALSVAISAGKTDIINLLLKKGVPVTIQHLSPAICAHNLKFIQLLFKPRHEEEVVEARADVLAKAAMCGDRPILDFLMRSAGNIPYSDVAINLSTMVSDTETPNLDLVKVLFAADPKIKNSTTLMLKELVSRGCGATFLAYLLEQGADVKNIVKEYMAANPLPPYPHPEMLKLFVEQGAKVNGITEWGNTALMRAIPDNNLAVVQYLLEHGAKVNIANELGNTPLHLAAARNLTEIVALLIKKGANVNVANSAGNTPLHQAVRFPSKYEVANLLLKSGAKINARNARGFTALHYAAARGSELSPDEATSVKFQGEAGPEVQAIYEWQKPQEQDAESLVLSTLIQDLIKNGADVRIKDNEGRYPIDMARLNTKHLEIVPILEAQMKKSKR